MLIKYGNKTLRRKSKNVKINIETEIGFYETLNEIDSITEDLLCSIKEEDTGISSVNVGDLIAVFCIWYKEDKLIFVNPHNITISGDKVDSREFNYSIKGEAIIKRHNKVKLSFYNKDIELKEETFNGRLAQLIIQQLDALNGDLYIDYMEINDYRKIKINNIKNK